MRPSDGAAGGRAASQGPPSLPRVRRPGPGPERFAGPPGEGGTYWLGGRRTAAAALRSGRALRLALVVGATGVEPLEQLAATARVPVERVRGDALDALGVEEAQGCAALVRPLRPVALEDLMATPPGGGGDRALLLLACDRLQDPRNMGAVARTVEAAGGAGLIVPSRRAVGVTPAAERVAAGAFESLPWAEVHNLPQALARCRQAGFWIYGASPEGEAMPSGVDWVPRSVLVIGAEGRGLSPLVRRACDRLVGLPMRGAVESLNASVAAGILLYDWVRWDLGRHVSPH